MEEVLSNQTALNKVVKHMLAQKEKAYDDRQKMCVYWDEDTGKKCAIGCLLTNKECTEIEGYGNVIGLMDGEVLPERLQDLDPSLLMDLQDVHDNKAPTDWLKELTKVAIQHNLSMPSG